ncbi:MAG: rod shape-determining protein MreC, partial [Planctomycetes bacterium]|nr:rod shape-determining protein MreC [Planctomycetota bacterium]
MASRVNPSTRNRLLALAFLGACAFCALSPSPWQDRVRGTVHTAAAPPLRALAGAEASAGRFLGRLSEMWRATEELERLRKENQALREALARLAAEAHDTAVRLRGFQGFDELRDTLPKQPLQVVPANVLGADTSPWRHSLIVDRGSADGVRLGTPAVWGASIVGTVVALRPHAATVRLLNDSRAGLKVRVARTGDVSVLRGTSDRDGSLQLKWLHLRPAVVGDLVVTAGLDPAIPPGLVAGR